MTPFELRTAGLLLRQGRRFNGVSMGLAALTVGGLMLRASMPMAPDAVTAALLGGSLLAAGTQLYCAIRTDFDAEVFLALADCRETDAARTLDATLHALGLRPAGEPERDWPERWRGARGWMRRQGALLALQVLLFAIAWCVAA